MTMDERRALLHPEQPPWLGGAHHHELPGLTREKALPPTAGGVILVMIAEAVTSIYYVVAGGYTAGCETRTAWRWAAHGYRQGRDRPLLEVSPRSSSWPVPGAGSRVGHALDVAPQTRLLAPDEVPAASTSTA
jgi:hypothetical protein